ncbi:MAG: hypothetical protein Q9217_003165 [Psora testacea]
MPLRFLHLFLLLHQLRVAWSAAARPVSALLTISPNSTLDETNPQALTNLTAQPPSFQVRSTYHGQMTAPLGHMMGITYALKVAGLAGFDEIEQRKYYDGPWPTAARVSYYNIEDRTLNCHLIWALHTLGERFNREQIWRATAFEIWLGPVLMGRGAIEPWIGAVSNKTGDLPLHLSNTTAPFKSITTTPSTNHDQLDLAYTSIPPFTFIPPLESLLLIITALAEQARIPRYLPIANTHYHKPRQNLSLYIVSRRGLTPEPFLENGWALEALCYLAAGMYVTGQYRTSAVTIGINGKEIGYINFFAVAANVVEKDGNDVATSR